MLRSVYLVFFGGRVLSFEGGGKGGGVIFRIFRLGRVFGKVGVIV